MVGRPNLHWTTNFGIGAGGLAIGKYDRDDGDNLHEANDRAENAEDSS